ncbi:MAG: hypothetical protein J2P15_18165, partial [Micromonosporaceae bacterium]|nr:hypothetical protein [Micromonosporaceae bacterium]
MLRRTAAGMALALALAVPLTGCGALTGASSTGAGADASAAPSVDAAKVLTDAVAKTSRVNVKAVLAGDTQDQDVTAVYDVHKKMAEITSKVDKDQLRIVLTSTDMYLGGLSDFQGQTLRLRLNKLTADSSFNLFADIL